MKIEKEVDGWVKDYLPEEQASELTSAIMYVIDRYNTDRHKKGFAKGLVVGMIVIVLVLKWAA